MEQNRVALARTGKSEAEVTNNKKLRSRFCTAETNYYRYEASRGLFATAALLIRSVIGQLFKK